MRVDVVSCPDTDFCTLLARGRFSLELTESDLEKFLCGAKWLLVGYVIGDVRPFVCAADDDYRPILESAYLLNHIAVGFEQPKCEVFYLTSVPGFGYRYCSKDIHRSMGAVVVS